MEPFDAFISYNQSTSGELAKRLHRSLQRIAQPWFRTRRIRVFLDDASLSATSESWSLVSEYLRNSRYLILLATPEAARSSWVRREVELWLELDRADRLLIGLVAGDIEWNPEGGRKGEGGFDWSATNALPPVLDGAFCEEPLWVDLRWARNTQRVTLRNPKFRRAVAKFAAPIEETEVEYLDSEDRRIHRNSIRLAVSAVLSLGLLLLISIFLFGRMNRERGRADKEEGRADAEELHAERAEDISEAQRLADLSVSALDTHPQVALLLAAQAIQATERHGDRVPSAEQALRDALTSSPGIGLGGHRDQVVDLACSPDGQWLASVDRSGAGFLWNLGSADPATTRIELSAEGGAGQVVEFSPNGQLLVTGGKKGVVWIWPVGEQGVIGPPRRLASGHHFLTGIVVSENGLATTSRDGLVRIHGYREGRIEESFLLGRAQHEQGIEAVGFFDPWLVTGGRQDLHTLRAFDLRAPQRHPSELGSDDDFGVEFGVEDIAFATEMPRFAVGGSDKVARVYQLDTAGEILGLQELTGHRGRVTSVVVAPDGQWCATGDSQGEVRLWNLEGDPRSRPETLLSGGAFLHDLAVSPDGRRLAAARDDGSVLVWDLSANRSLITRIQSHEGGVLDIEFTPDGNWLVSGGEDGMVRLLASDEIADGYLLESNDSQGRVRLVPAALTWNAGHAGRFKAVDSSIAGVIALRASSSGRRFAVVGADGTICAWEIVGINALNTQLRERRGGANFVAFLGDSRLVVGGKASQPEVFQLREQMDPDRNLRFDGRSLQTSLLALSPDDRWLAAAYRDGAIVVWDLQQPTEEPRLLAGLSSPATELLFGPDSRRCVAGSADGTLLSWALGDESGRHGESLGSTPEFSLPGDGVEFTRTVFGGRGRWLARAVVPDRSNKDAIVRLWNLAERSPGKGVDLGSHEGGVFCLASDRLGKWIMTGDRTGIARLVDLEAAKPIDAVVNLETSNVPLLRGSFSRDGRWLVAGNSRGEVWLWDLSNRDLQSGSHLLAGHTSQITALAIDPASRFVASASMDKTIRVWDLLAESPAESAVILRGHPIGPSRLAFSADGEWLISSDTMRPRVFHWPLTRKILLHEARIATGRNLTEKEWAEFHSRRNFERVFAELD